MHGLLTGCGVDEDSVHMDYHKIQRKRAITCRYTAEGQRTKEFAGRHEDNGWADDGDGWPALPGQRVSVDDANRTLLGDDLP